MVSGEARLIRSAVKPLVSTIELPPGVRIRESGPSNTYQTKRQAREIFAQALTESSFWTLHYTEMRLAWQDFLVEIKKCLFFVLMAILMDRDD